MKILKKVLIALLIIIAIPLVVALFIPKDFTSEATVVVNKPKADVFNYIKFVKNQDQFGVWQRSDPSMKTMEQGTDGTIGFKYSWEGEKLGKGSQTITNIAEGERMESALDFGFGEPAKGYIATKAISPTQTSVTWGISGNSPYPWNLMTLFVNMDGDFKKGLEQLKMNLEQSQ